MQRVSVIIPTYNCAQYIREAVESVLSQTYRFMEIIIVDDGSSDNTRKLLEIYNNKIRYIYQDNKGPSAARNRGIKEASGDYISFLDADDVWMSDKLESQIKKISVSAAIGIVYCAAQIVDSRGRLGKLITGKEFSQAQMMQKLLMKNIVTGSTSSVLIKRECFADVGLFDETLKVAEDWDMWLRISKKYVCGYIDKPLVKIRLRDGSQSSCGTKNIENEIRFLEKAFSDKAVKYRFIIKAKAYSYRYFCAAWAFLTAGEKKEAFKYIIKSILSNPIFFIMDKERIGLAVRIFFGDRIFKAIKACL